MFLIIFYNWGSPRRSPNLKLCRRAPVQSQGRAATKICFKSLAKQQSEYPGRPGYVGKGCNPFPLRSSGASFFFFFFPLIRFSLAIFFFLRKKTSERKTGEKPLPSSFPPKRKKRQIFFLYFSFLGPLVGSLPTILKRRKKRPKNI
uniref:hypothetical protein n=1 Tax=Cephaleuros parasiticus TaxID=173370 RepID=UPI001EE06108|nr:hypothetical protein MFQ79_pgp061 [Cephaleuros parasiticus]UIB39001.1 hypothetical protein [Cephaleuros parasiticus]